MTFVFQIAAIVVIAIFAILGFRGGGARQQALRRVVMVLFILAAASSLLFPQVWTWAANLVGIGRGTDLLLYLMVLIFLGFVASTYRRFRRLEHDTTALARKIAVEGARPPADADPRD